MDLEELFTSEIDNIYHQILDTFIPKIEQASPEAKSKAKRFHISILLKDCQDLFFQKTDPKDKYHFIESFYQKYFHPLRGLYNSFDKELDLAKAELLETYRDHAYLPNVNQFLSQSNEDIVSKMAMFKGYIKAIDYIKRQSFKNIDPEILIESLGIDKVFRNLFHNKESFQKATFIINKYLDEEGKFAGLKSTPKKSEIVALVHVLNDNNYFKLGIDLTNAGIIFGFKYSMNMKPRTARTVTGNAFRDAVEEFEVEIHEFIK